MVGKRSPVWSPGCRRTTERNAPRRRRRGNLWAQSADLDHSSMDIQPIALLSGSKSNDGQGPNDGAPPPGEALIFRYTLNPEI